MSSAPQRRSLAAQVVCEASTILPFTRWSSKATRDALDAAAAQGYPNAIAFTGFRAHDPTQPDGPHFSLWATWDKNSSLHETPIRACRRHLSRVTSDRMSRLPTKSSLMHPARELVGQIHAAPVRRDRRRRP